MKNLLIIENDEESLQKIISSLNQEEFYIHIAETGSRGYHLALKIMPSLIICNKNIFEKKGNEQLIKLRDETFISSIPFIFLLDVDYRKRHKTQFHGELDFHIRKPFDKTELLKIVKVAYEKYEAVRKKSEKRITELTGSLSLSLPHEFFTPLNGILGFVEILIDDFDSTAKKEKIEMLKYIQKDAVRLKKLTDHFLTFAQIEMIEKDYDKVNALRKSYFINPKEIIEKIAKDIAEENNRIDDLVFEIEDTAVRISEEYLKKLIFEIINNAFKFSKKNSPVIISALSNDNGVMISITDHGRGMSKKQIASIGAYMQFERKDNEQQGAGLGLIIAKKITELHGGDFVIESIEGENTKVHLYFDN